MRKLIVIAGPTAIGKTAIAIELALRLGGEIISADSMQVYKHMDIGTAKPMREEMKGVSHYLIDELEPDKDYSVAIFVRRAKAYLEDIYRRGKQPIVVGGTGFYINALVYDNSFNSSADESDAEPAYREKLYKIAKSQGADSLHKILAEVDLISAQRIHPNNVKRIVRALEFYKLEGRSISDHNDLERERSSPYDTSFLILNMSRERLYHRIEKRVDKMLEDGLVGEVQRLLDNGVSPDSVSMRGLGYKELVPYIQGQIPLDEAVELLKRNTRRFAKRQLTWFKNRCDGIWINVDETDNTCIIEGIISELRVES